MSKFNPGEILDDMVEKFGGTRILWGVLFAVAFVAGATLLGGIV